jgi:uncharacterized membrane protein YfcA
MQDALSVGSGALVGLVLGLVGGGGSILAVPLLIYVVGVPSTHLAIGTSAVAVAASAAINVVGHARAHTVKWPCAIVFALSGVAGTALGAHLGKLVDGDRLLALFGALMIAVGLSMLRRRRGDGDPDVRLTRETTPRMLPLLVATGLVVGVLSGFFGIGGGFLIVPGLVAATAMPLLNAIGSSLVSVTAFGLTTAASYAASGLVDWRVAALFVAGGVAGGLIGIALATRLAARKNALARLFASVVIAVGAGILGATLLR